jgi:hypothetical protein
MTPVMYTDYSGYKATVGDWIFVVGLAVVCVALVAVAAPVLFLGAAYLSTGTAIAMFSTGAIVGSKMLTIGKAQSMYSRDEGDNNSEIVNDTVEALGNFSKWFTFTESTMFIGKSIAGLGKEIYNLGIDTGAVKDIPRLPESNGNFASAWSGIQTGWRVGQTFVAMTDDDLCYDLANKYGWTPE